MVAILLGILGGLFQLVGLVGCVLPVLPGPPISWLGLLLLDLGTDAFSWRFLLLWGGIAAAVTALDYVVPARGAKQAGASRAGVWGSVVGMILGMFAFPPFGMLVGAFLGAVLGELAALRSAGESLKAGWGVFLGTLQGIVLKLIASVMMTWYFVAAVF